MLRNSGKNTGITIGKKIIPKIVIPIEHITLKIFNRLFCLTYIGENIQEKSTNNSEDN